jgi:hypothetical protein
MALTVEDLEDQSKYRQSLKLPYDEMIPFILDYIRRKSVLMIFFWSCCIVFLGMALIVRFNISGYFPLRNIFCHSILGFVIMPLIYAPFHELLHVIPYFFTGARRIRIGMDLRQYLFYVTAHRHVTNSSQFRFVALVPFLVTSIGLVWLILVLPGLWKWSLALFLFAHTTMCAGDFALLNYYSLHKGRKIYTWDDADEKVAYFYEEI